MSRLLAVFWYYFSWQRTMARVTIGGLAMIVAGIALERASLSPLSVGLRAFLIGTGSMLAVVFPVLLAGLAFRHVVARRRFTLLPRYRAFAVMGLMLLALAASGMAFVFVYYMPTTSNIEDPLAFGLLAFSAISAYLLISQWLIVHPLGLMFFAFVPLVAIRLGVWGNPVLAAELQDPWPFAALALCGWAWFFVAVRKRARLRGLAMPSWGGEVGYAAQGNGGWWPQIDPPATSAGTLLRGAGDGWLSRIATELMFVLAFPATLMIVFYVMGMPLSAPEPDPRPIWLAASVFLFLSFYGVSMSSSMVFAEWPARLRYIWLRIAGDRGACWRFLERALFAEAVIVGGITTLVAAAYLVFTEFPSYLLLLYVGGSIVVMFAASYFGFWVRISGRSIVLDVIFLAALVLLVPGVVAFLRSSDSPGGVLWLVPAFGLIGFGFRALARRGFSKMDWCAVRPARRAAHRPSS